MKNCTNALTNYLLIFNFILLIVVFLNMLDIKNEQKEIKNITKEKNYYECKEIRGINKRDFILYCVPDASIKYDENGNVIKESYKRLEN
jgi:hypothetical protein